MVCALCTGLHFWSICILVLPIGEFVGWKPSKEGSSLPCQLHSVSFCFAFFSINIELRFKLAVTLGLSDVFNC